MSKINLTRNELVNVNNGVHRLLASDEKFNIKFTYALGKNKRIINVEIESLQEALNACTEKYRDAATAFNDALGEKILPEEKAKLIQENDIKLREEFKDKIKAAEDFMNDKVDIEVHSIDLLEVPAIPADLGEAIFPLISEKE